MQRNARAPKQVRSAENHRTVARDGRRAVLAAILLGFVAATSLSDGKLIPDFAPAAPVATPDVPNDDALRTGSILITPGDGNICELRLIDNATWRIHPGGEIECDDAVAWQTLRSDAYTAQSRIEAIRDGFVSKAPTATLTPPARPGRPPVRAPGH